MILYLRSASTAGLDGWMESTLVVDTVRAVRLKSEGYKIVTQTIPCEITPKNRLLMGEYQGHTTQLGNGHPRLAVRCP